MATRLLSLLCLLVMLSCVYCDEDVLDMTYELNAATLHWPNVTEFKLTNTYEGAWQDVPYMISNDFKVAEHLGTHMDAPVHFARGKWFVHEIPVRNFIGPAVVIDMSAKAAKDPDTRMMVEDLEAWEEKHGKIPDGSILFVNNGWGKFWGNMTLFRGITHPTDDITQFHFPGMHEEAAQWLVDNRNIKGFGSDTLSLDYGQTQTFPVHQILLGANIFGLEMVANIHKLPPKGATVYVMPIKITNGTGGATRIVATGYSGINGGGVVLPGMLILLLSFVAQMICL